MFISPFTQPLSSKPTAFGAKNLTEPETFAVTVIAATAAVVTGCIGHQALSQVDSNIVSNAALSSVPALELGKRVRKQLSDSLTRDND